MAPSMVYSAIIRRVETLGQLSEIPGIEMCLYLRAQAPYPVVNELSVSHKCRIVRLF
jgi:hypothetical protein